MSWNPDILAEFKSVFGQEAELAVSAPGRVNLIGEHTDYNRGWVLPMAVERRIWAAAKPTTGGIELSSANMTQHVSIDKPTRRTGTWADYPIGVIWAHRGGGCNVPGVKIHYHGNVPLGGGLSSSAAIEVATAFLLLKFCGLPLSRKQIALTCQLAENHFVGMKCGIMDQMTSALAQSGKALYIDCNDLNFDMVPFENDDYVIVVIDSGVKRKLAGSAYNKRRKECEEAANKLGAKSLRDISVEDIDKVESLPEPLNRRVRHVVTENHRVHEASGHLREGRFDEFGSLMTQSHESLHVDFEVSIPELDFLVDSCNRIDGVLGARLTGGGFGGAIVALAKAEAVSRIEKEVVIAYREIFDKEAKLMTTKPAEGVRVEYS